MGVYPCSAIIVTDLAARLSPGPPGRPASAVHDPCAVSADLLAVLEWLFEQTILVAADAGRLLACNALIVSDHFPGCSVLGGIHAGLFASRTLHAMVVAGDMQTEGTAIIDRLMGAIGPRWDVTLPAAAPQTLLLPAVFAQSAMPHLEKLLSQGKTDLQAFLDRVRIRTVGPTGDPQRRE